MNQTNVSNELAAAPVGKLLFKLAVPTVIAQLVNLLYNIVEFISAICPEPAVLR